MSTDSAVNKYRSEVLDNFQDFLVEHDLDILSFDPSKTRNTIVTEGSLPFTVAKFIDEIKMSWFKSENINKYQLVQGFITSTKEMTDLLKVYAKDRNAYKEKIQVSRTSIYPDLQLYCDQSDEEAKYFTADKETHIKSEVTGKAYLKAKALSVAEANAESIYASQTYNPEKETGLFVGEDESGRQINMFNNFIKPLWQREFDDSGAPEEIPELFRMLVDHVITKPIEREYFYSWLYYSLYERAFTFLVLCGAPGVGKNVLKKVIRALHGFENTVDGKKSTFSERFNSQIRNCTLLWFDELKYGPDQENSMKEVQNDTISIEAKGVDATRSTRIYASMVIVNNKPRDNYIDFEARKFTPLMLNPARLEESMNPEQISKLSEKVSDPKSDTYDHAFIADIGYWIKKNGRSRKWPNLEYKGPMFYRLAHTSMTRWQKKTVQLIVEFTGKKPNKVDLHDTKGFKWSTIVSVEDSRRAGKGLQFPAHSSVEAFLDSFRDAEGTKCFETASLETKMNIDDDFWVKCTVKEIKIFNRRDLRTKEVKHGKHSTEDSQRKDVERSEGSTPETSNKKKSGKAGSESAEEKKVITKSRRGRGASTGQQSAKEKNKEEDVGAGAGDEDYDVL